MTTSRTRIAVAALVLSLLSGAARAGAGPASRARPLGASANAATTAAAGVRFVRRPGVPWASPDAAAREHLRAIGAAGPERRGGADLALASVHDTGRGAIVVRYRDEVDGIPVFRGGVNVVLTRARALVAVSGPASRPARPDAWRGGAPFRLDAEQGVRAAFLHLGVAVARDGVRADADRERFLVRGEGARRPGGPARARRVLVASGGRLLPAWHVEALLATPAEPGVEAYGMVVSADDGRVLFRNDRLRTAPFTYRVYRSSAGLPLASSPYCDDGFPHPTGVPDGFQPATPCAQQDWTLSSYVGADPWLDDAATQTAGNAVDAFFEMCVDAGGNWFTYRPDELDTSRGDFRASATGSHAFLYPYDPALTAGDGACSWGPGAGLAQDPQTRAKIVQAFVAANVLHDVMRAHGFDEASGNAQELNFGRGGLEHDALRVVLGGSTWAAPMSDGYPSVLSAGILGTGSNRDAALDLSVFAHEWMHVLNYRLVGDADGLSNSQGGALGEGWSDFFGVLTEVRPGQDALASNADWTGTYALSAYSNTGFCWPRPCDPPPPGEDQSWYFGIRRYPFTVDPAKSPLTFRWLEDDVPRPAGIPTYTWKGRFDNAEGHNAGEIWASALWHCYRELLRDPRNDFAAAQARMLDVLVAGMKATPVDPTFTDARDALLAVVAATDATDLAHFEAAFAARGMGAGAVSPARDSVELHGVVESFAASGPGLALASVSLGDAGGGDADGILDAGEAGLADVVLHNTGFQDLSSAEVWISSPAFAVAPAPASGLAVARGADLVVHFSNLSLVPGTATYAEVPVTVGFRDVSAGLAARTETRSFRVNHDVHRTSLADDAESEVTLRDWTVSGWVAGCGGGYPSREHGWRRKPHPPLVAGGAGAFAYAAPAAVCTYESTMTSGWFWAGPSEAWVTFRASFDVPDGGTWALGWAEVLGAGDEPIARIALAPPLLPTVESLFVAAADHPRLVRIRLGVQVDGGSAPGSPDVLFLDDVGVSGAAGAPFSAVAADGTAGPPRAAFRASVAGTAVTFTDESTPGGAAIVARAWSFGDSGTSTDASPTHDYAGAWPGEYVATLTVTDAAGNQDVAVQPVRPEFALRNGVPWGTPTTPVGASLFSADVPEGTVQLRFRVTPASNASVEVIARHEDPVVLPPLYSASQPTAYGDAVWGPSPAVLTIAYPRAGRWHLAVVGPSSGVVATWSGPGDGSAAPGGGGCGCGASGGGGLGALVAGLLVAMRRRRPASRR